MQNDCIRTLTFLNSNDSVSAVCFSVSYTYKDITVDDFYKTRRCYKIFFLRDRCSINFEVVKGIKHERRVCRFLSCIAN